MEILHLGSFSSLALKNRGNSYDSDLLTHRNFQSFCLEKLTKEGLSSNDMTEQFMRTRISAQFPDSRLRQLMRLYEQKPFKKADGGKRKKDEHSSKPLTLSSGIRLVDRPRGNRRPFIAPVFDKVEKQLNTWRSSGFQVLTQDMMHLFKRTLEAHITELQGKSSIGTITEAEYKVLCYALHRMEHLTGQNRKKNEQVVICQMEKNFHFKGRSSSTFSPIGIGEEYRRLLETWGYWDVCLHKACFADIKELEDWVIEPQQFRDNIGQTMIAMSDQFLFWITGDMTQKRGSDDSQRKDQKDIRITLDVEQTLEGFFTEGEPIGDLGNISVILPGAQRSSLGKKGSYLYSIELLLYVLASSA